MKVIDVIKGAVKKKKDRTRTFGGGSTFTQKAVGFNQAREQILNSKVDISKAVDVKKIDKIIKDYFGYKDISEPIYNMRYGCSLAQAILTNLNKCGK